MVDLLFASCGIEPEIVAEAEMLEVLPELPIPVARVGHLLTMKLLAGRPRDLEDVESLLDVADASEIARAWDAVRLLTERGYERDQDLELRFRTILARRAQRSRP